MTQDELLFDLRWQRSEPDLVSAFRRLYGQRPEIEARLKALLQKSWAERPEALKQLDLKRDLNPDWFLSEKMIGYVFYVDRFAGNFKGVLKHIDYLKSLGVTYVHFMPCLKPRGGNSDGGYSVMDYRAINPELGTMADFEKVTSTMRENDISVCVDLVLNHTAKEHDWAMRAKAGDVHYQNYYRMFDTKEQTLEYEKTLVEIFPNDAPGNFTFYPELNKYVWTTFNEHQWDLNWENPEVFLEIVSIMLNLANRGVDCLRLDAVAFMWKRLGTNCQNLPEVHDVLQALRAATRIAAPAMIHKAEAIVSPRDLVPYLGTGIHKGKVANLAYHNNVMVQFWASLATQDVRLMVQVLRTHFPENFRNASWATYIRCHDDIGWAITDEDCAHVPGISAYGHRKFLADFYTGQFEGSFAKGGIFQENLVTGDRRNSGSFASLAGLESALSQEDIDLSLKRILLGTALMCAFGGLPLLYMGDEIGLTNDYDFEKYPDHAHDNRWMHRPKMQWDKLSTTQTHLLDATRHIIARRQALPQLAAGNPTRIIETGNDKVFGFVREGDEGPALCLYSFSDKPTEISDAILMQYNVKNGFDCLQSEKLTRNLGNISLAPYAALWII